MVTACCNLKAYWTTYTVILPVQDALTYRTQGDFTFTNVALNSSNFSASSPVANSFSPLYGCQFIIDSVQGSYGWTVHDKDKTLKTCCYGIAYVVSGTSPKTDVEDIILDSCIGVVFVSITSFGCISPVFLRQLMKNCILGGQVCISYKLYN